MSGEPRVIGRYRVERELGRGGMATVYLAHDAKHDRRVALKVLKPELSAALGAERFLQEIQVTARLSHPHIVPLHDSGEAEGLLYYVMPYVAGESLRGRLERETHLPVDEALRITQQVVAALDFAHRQEVHGPCHGPTAVPTFRSRRARRRRRDAKGAPHCQCGAAGYSPAS